MNEKKKDNLRNRKKRVCCYNENSREPENLIFLIKIFNSVV
jgi:hypothetical protein